MDGLDIDTTEIEGINWLVPLGALDKDAEAPLSQEEWDEVRYRASGPFAPEAGAGFEHPFAMGLSEWEWRVGGHKSYAAYLTKWRKRRGQTR